jgi:hypothetical protein
MNYLTHCDDNKYPHDNKETCSCSFDETTELLHRAFDKALFKVYVCAFKKKIEERFSNIGSVTDIVFNAKKREWEANINEIKAEREELQKLKKELLYGS